MKPYAKAFAMVEPQTVAAASTSTSTVDCSSFSFGRIHVLFGTGTATTKTTTLSIAECSSSNGTFTDVTAFVGTTGTVVTTSSGFCIPIAKTNATQEIMFEIDLKKRERYLQVTVAPAVAQGLCVLAEFSKAVEMPVGATEAGVDVLVQG